MINITELTTTFQVARFNFSGNQSGPHKESIPWQPINHRISIRPQR